MVHAALLLLMLEAATADLVSTISLKRRTPNLQLSTRRTADYPICCRRPATARTGFPAPKRSEAGTVPTQQRLRPYNLQCVQHPGSQAISPTSNSRSMLLSATRFGDLRRSTLS